MTEISRSIQNEIRNIFGLDPAAKNRKTEGAAKGEVAKVHREAMDPPATEKEQRSTTASIPRGFINSSYREHLSPRALTKASINLVRNLLSHFKTPKAQRTASTAETSWKQEHQGALEHLLEIKEQHLNRLKNPDHNKNPEQTLHLLKNDLQELKLLCEGKDIFLNTDGLSNYYSDGSRLSNDESKAALKNLNNPHSTNGKKYENLLKSYQKAIDCYEALGYTGQKEDIASQHPITSSTSATSSSQEDSSVSSSEEASSDKESPELARDKQFLKERLDNLTSSKVSLEDKRDIAKYILKEYVEPDSFGGGETPLRDLGIPLEDREYLINLLENPVKKGDFKEFVRIAVAMQDPASRKELLIMDVLVTISPNVTFREFLEKAETLLKKSVDTIEDVRAQNLGRFENTSKGEKTIDTVTREKDFIKNRLSEFFEEARLSPDQKARLIEKYEPYLDEGVTTQGAEFMATAQQAWNEAQENLEALRQMKTPDQPNLSPLLGAWKDLRQNIEKLDKAREEGDKKMLNGDITVKGAVLLSVDYKTDKMKEEFKQFSEDLREMYKQRNSS